VGKRLHFPLYEKYRCDPKFDPTPITTPSENHYTGNNKYNVAKLAPQNYNGYTNYMRKYSMKEATTRKTSRKPVADDCITARIPHANRLLIERAAAVYGSTLNQFIVQSTLDRAGEILEREETLRLSERDTSTFLHALENPSNPSEKLIAALQAHDRLVKC